MDVSPALLTLLVLGVMIVLFVTEIIPLAVTAMSGAIVLGVLGVITPKEVFSGLANSMVVLFAGMFVIGSAMYHTGLAQKVGGVVARSFGKSEQGAVFGVMLVAVFFSSVISNTGVTATLMPVVIGVCAVSGFSPSRMLMPLAFASGLGGTITLLGTPPNILANTALAGHGLTPFGFLEFSLIGIPLAITGVLYMVFVGRELLPDAKFSPIADMYAAQKSASKPEQNPRKMLITALVLLVVVAVIALDFKRVPMEMAAAIGAMVLVLTGCLKEEQAYKGIDWVTIFLFAGMVPMAIALEKSGAGKMIADMVVATLPANPHPVILCAAIFLLGAMLTQFMPSTAAAGLLLPIGLSIASSMAVSPQAVVMIIAMSASCAFATPIATPCNTLILGVGHYHFSDYLRVGLPLTFVYMLVCCLLIPLIWPFGYVQ